MIRSIGLLRNASNIHLPLSDVGDRASVENISYGVDSIFYTLNLILLLCRRLTPEDPHTFP
jgi:hypothetical protein